MKAYKVLRFSRNPICGVSVGQENRLDVTNPHMERFFKNLKNRPDVGVWYRLLSHLLHAKLSKNRIFRHFHALCCYFRLVIFYKNQNKKLSLHA